MKRVETSPSQERARDTASAMCKALETEGIWGEIINIGRGNTLKMKGNLVLIKRETDTRKKVVLKKSRVRPRDVEMQSKWQSKKS